MRVNIYAEEMTNRVEVVQKTTADGTFTGVRFHLHLPVTLFDSNGKPLTQVQGAFMHGPKDDDSSAVTFWGKQRLREMLHRALRALDDHAEVMGRSNECSPMQAPDRQVNP